MSPVRARSGLETIPAFAPLLEEQRTLPCLDQPKPIMSTRPRKAHVLQCLTRSSLTRRVDGKRAELRPILIVGNLLHPVDALSVESLGDGDVDHRRGGCRAMPMFLAGRYPNDIAGSDILLWASFRLHPAHAEGDNQGLAQRMRMPGRSCAGFECHDGAANAGGLATFEAHVDPDPTGEILRRTFRRWLRAAAHDVHGHPPKMIAGGRVAMRPASRQQYGRRAAEHRAARNIALATTSRPLSWYVTEWMLTLPSSFLVMAPP